MCVTVIAGFSVDFTAHIAIAYTAASGTHVTSYARCQSALSQLGVSVLSGATSTALATAMLACCAMIPFSKFGLFMMLNVIFSVAVALGPFICLLLVLGPQNDAGVLRFKCESTRSLTMQHESQTRGALSI